MKKLTFIALIAFVFLSCSHNSHPDVDEIMDGLEDVLSQLNDSSVQTIVINSGESRKIMSDIQRDSAGVMIVNVNIPDNFDNMTPDVPSFVAPVAIISVIGVFLAPVLFVFVICYFIYKNKKERNRIIYESVVTGRTLPKEFYKIRPHNARFQSAVSWLAWSIGLFVFFMVVGWDEAAPLMLIPFVIGLGKLGAFFMYDYKKDNVE